MGKDKHKKMQNIVLTHLPTYTASIIFSFFFTKEIIVITYNAIMKSKREEICLWWKWKETNKIELIAWIGGLLFKDGLDKNNSRQAELFSLKIGPLVYYASMKHDKFEYILNYK